MHTESKTRQQKLVDALFAYFGDMAAEVPGDAHTLRICHHLLTLGDEVMNAHTVLFFVDVWNSEHPEEDELTSREVRWALEIFDTTMTQRIKERRKALLDAKSTRPKLRVINGGLSANPDRPYMPPRNSVQDYELDF